MVVWWFGGLVWFRLVWFGWWCKQSVALLCSDESDTERDGNRDEVCIVFVVCGDFACACTNTVTSARVPVGAQRYTNTKPNACAKRWLCVHMYVCGFPRL